MKPNWKAVCSLLVTVLLTGLGAWLSFGKDSVTRAEWVSITEKLDSVVKDEHQREKATAILETKLDFLIKEVGSIKEIMLRRKDE
jgi:hypothetical protein